MCHKEVEIVNRICRKIRKMIKKSKSDEKVEKW